MSDLNESLRNPSRFADHLQTMEDAADEIERLTAERDELRIRLSQQSELVEKCMAAMNENADRGEKAEAEFKNFHRALCERFGYYHDPIDWKRDQVSLIEHIAKKTAVIEPDNATK